MRSLLVLLSIMSPAVAADWPQFRGVGGRAVATADVKLPAKLDLDEHVQWKVAVPKGHSSPVIVGGRVLLTAFDGEKLWTLALNARTGETLWRREAPAERIEKVHRVGSPATPSVACDVERGLVVSKFGSCGLFCHDLDGEHRWTVPLGPFDNSFGSSSSPIVVDGRVVIVEDHDTGSYLACFDVATGEQRWRVERPDIRRGFGSPIVCRTDRRTEVVVASGGRLTSYALADGTPVWQVRGLCRVVSNTPVVGEDGRLYVASNGGGSAPNEPTFAQLVPERDANGNGRLEPKELPASPIKSFFDQFDGDKDGSLNEAEYESVRRVFAESSPAAMAVRPGGTGDVTKSHVDWRYSRSIPRNASPVLHDDVLFLVRDGGVLVGLDAESGQQIHQARLPGSGKQYSSPIVADGKLFVADDRGVLSIVSTEGDFDVLSSVDLGDPIFATPAAADGALFVRTTTTLYRLGSASDR